MKEKIRKAFRASSFRYGTYSIIITAVVLAIVIAINLVVGQLPTGMKNIDISEQKLYSVGDTTINLVSALQEDVKIYVLATAGSEDETVMQLVKNYADLSGHISYETVDPNTKPSFLETYDLDSEDLTGEGATDILVASDKRSKLITYSEIYEADQQSVYYYYMYGTAVQYNFDGEGEITSAVSYVTTDNLPKMYLLTGHNEEQFGTSISSLVSKNSVITESLNLMTKGEIPEDCDILAIIKPSTDLTEDEVNLIEEYITYGGNCLIINFANKQANMPNYTELLKFYGVSIPSKAYVFEASGYCYSPYRWFLYEPCTAEHEIVSSLGSSSAIYTTYAQPIIQYDDKRNTLEIEAFLTTSEGSWLRSDLDSEIIDEKIDSDVDGPFDIAVTITDTSSYGTGKVVLYSTYDIINEDVLTKYPSMVNEDVFINSVQYLGSLGSSINIAAKTASLSHNSVTVAQYQSGLMIFVIGLPLCILLFGFAVWFRRRRR